MKMRLLDAINYFLHFFRRSGTTTLLEKIYSNNDVYVIVTNQEERENFKTTKNKKNIVTLQDIKEGKGLGLSHKPILFDSSALSYLINDTTLKIENLENKLYKSERAISKIKEVISNYERGW